MDLLHIYKLVHLLAVYLICMSYSVYGRLYSTGKSTHHGSGYRRNEEPLNAEVYISNLWQKAVGRNNPENDSKGHHLILTPNGSPGPAIIKVLPNDGSLTKHPLTILTNGADDDPMDITTSYGKILNIPDSPNGPISIVKSYGPTSSIIVSPRGGNSFQRSNAPFKKKLKNVQKNIAFNKKGTHRNNSDLNTRNSYIGSFTGFLAETLCPLCRRLSNPRLRISCLLRYCYENPNFPNGNPR